MLVITLPVLKTSERKTLIEFVYFCYAYYLVLDKFATLKPTLIDPNTYYYIDSIRSDPNYLQKDTDYTNYFKDISTSFQTDAGFYSVYIYFYYLD